MKHAFMLAATGSGCGKTTITCAILSLLKRRGYALRSFKCGPDFIDPMFHREVLSVPAENLDLFFTDENAVRKHFLSGNDSEISVVEGVMGLFDGMSASSEEASSYHLACALDIPVILIVDAKGMGRSLLALLKGFLAMDRENRICGVLLNNISAGYFAKIAPVIEEELKLPVPGFLPKLPEGAFTSRYLGLTLPEELQDVKDRVEKTADALSKSLDLERLLSLTGVNREPEKRKALAEKPKVRIAVARDAAFCFYYEENLRMLREAGAGLLFFSPLADEALPEGISGLILGGGYPELFAQELSENRSMRESIRNALAGGLPHLAECGGFMYLHEQMITEEKKAYPMVGAIKGSCSYAGHLVRFGYMVLEDTDCVFLPSAANTIRGHEFHYFDSTANGTDALCKKPASGTAFRAGYISPLSWCGFAHLYYPSNPAFPTNFVNVCAENNLCF